jgi:hypothetical protein
MSRTTYVSVVSGSLPRRQVSAGGTVTIDFTADIPGQFEVEAHKLSPSLLFTLVVK